MTNIEEAIELIKKELDLMELDYKKGFTTGRIVRLSEKFKNISEAYLLLQKAII